MRRRRLRRRAVTRRRVITRRLEQAIHRLPALTLRRLPAPTRRRRSKQKHIMRALSHSGRGRRVFAPRVRDDSGFYSVFPRVNGPVAATVAATITQQAAI